MGLDDEPVVNVAVVLLTLIPFEAKLPRDQLIVCYGLDESFMTSFPNVGSLVFASLRKHLTKAKGLLDKYQDAEEPGVMLSPL